MKKKDEIQIVLEISHAVKAVPKLVRARRRVALVAARTGADDLLDEVDAVELAVRRADESAGRVNRVLCLDHASSLSAKASLCGITPLQALRIRCQSGFP